MAKTTLELPDELMRDVRIRAVNEGRRLKDVTAELLRLGLAAEPEGPGVRAPRVRLPLVDCAHEAERGEEMTPERVAEALLAEEARGASQAC